MTRTSVAQKRTDMPESEAIASRSLADKRPSAALLDALAETDIDLAETDMSLSDQVETDALDMLFRNPDESTQFSAVVWDYQVVVTPDVVLVFDAMSDGDRSR